jgi:hypothetical protein
VNEKALQGQILQLCKLYNWRAYHTFLSVRSEPGFPDLVLVRDRVLYREIKTDVGKVTPAQKAWLDALLWAGADVGVWRETDLRNGRIVQELSRKRVAA